MKSYLRILPIFSIVIIFIVSSGCSSQNVQTQPTNLVNPISTNNESQPTDAPALIPGSDESNPSNSTDSFESQCPYAISCGDIGSDCGEVTVKSPDLSKKLTIPIRLKNDINQWGWFSLEIDGFAQGSETNSFWTDLYKGADDPEYAKWYTNEIGYDTQYGTSASSISILTFCYVQLKNQFFLSVEPLEKPVSISKVIIRYHVSSIEPSYSIK